MATTQIKNGYQGGSNDQMKVNTDGSINTTATITGGNITVTESGLDSFKTSQYTVGVTAVQIVNPALTNRSSISLRVTAGVGEAIFIGTTAGVTTSGPTGGYPLYNGDTLQMDLTPANTIFAIATAAGQTLFALEIA